MFLIYCPQVDDYIPLPIISLEPFIIPISYFSLPTVLFKYYPHQEAEISSIRQDQSIEFSQPEVVDKAINMVNQNVQQILKKQRSPERSIIQVVEIVRKWRMLQTKLIQGRRLSLKETADEIGVSKKSLDDYFYQLRVGEFYGFDFEAHLNKKIGFLRSFIKKSESESKKKVTSQKLPKKLKIFDKFASLAPQKVPFRQKNLQKAPNYPLQTKPVIHLVESKEKSPQQSIKKQSKITEEIDFIAQPKIKRKGSFSDQGFFWGNPFDSISEQVLCDCEKNFFDDFRPNAPDNNPFVGYSLNRFRSESQNSLNSFNLF